MTQQEFMIDDDGIRLHCKLDVPDTENGAERLILLFPGFSGDMEEPQIISAKDAMNEAGFAVLRSELYGHGKSGGTFKEHTLLKWLDNAIAVTDYARKLPSVRELHVCGHSQGGLLGILLAAVKPDVFSSMILLSPAVTIPYDAKRGMMLGQSFDPDHIPETIGVWYDMELSGNYARIAKLIDVEAAASAYHGPTVIIHGEQDETVPFQASKRILHCFNDAELIPVEGAMHCYEEKLDVLKQCVKEFLIRQKKTED